MVYIRTKKDRYHVNPAKTKMRGTETVQFLFCKDLMKIRKNYIVSDESNV